MVAAHFTLFPQLPVEIRLQIWELALEPETSGPVLFHLKSGCWQPRYLTPSDAEFNQDDDELNLVFEFRHDLLDEAEYTVPLFFVSHEARSVALPYIQSQKLRPSQDTASCIFTRRYDARRDIVWTPTPDTLQTLLTEPFERTFEPDLDEKIFISYHPSIFRLAITRSGLASLGFRFAGLWEHYALLELVYIVLGDGFEDDPHMARPEEGRHWEGVSVHDTAVYVWDASEQRMAWQGERNADGPLGEVFAQVESCTKGLAEKLAEMGRDQFEMRLVRAVSR